jgi:hypothetical protein
MRTTCPAHLIPPWYDHSNYIYGDQHTYIHTHIWGVSALNSVSTTPWRREEQWRYSSTILNLSTRLRRVVTFKPRPLYKTPQSPLDRRLGGPQRWAECSAEYKKKILVLPHSATARTTVGLS